MGSKSLYVITAHPLQVEFEGKKQNMIMEGEGGGRGGTIIELDVCN
jgi:hypothetical protein